MLPLPIASFFSAENAEPGQERFDTLYRNDSVTIERIVSSGQQPIGRYCQTHDEWVLLVRGTATLRIDGEIAHINAGDYLTLHANVPHEVIKTSENALWLAVHTYPHTSKDE
jgi:cupin 2 domain-containing protein